MPFSLPRDDGGAVLPVVKGSGVRVNLTAASTSSNAAIPAGALADGVVIVRAVGGAVWLNFGTSAAVTASAAITSALFVEGEGLAAVPAGTTHVAVLRVGSSDVVVQLESIV